MQYQGGKERIAKHIAEILISAGGGRSTYIEPFLGGASVFARVAPHFTRAIGADVVPDVAMLWDAAARGWEPPYTLSRDEYAALRDAEPSALRAFAGFGCSFGGKWFGGYASDGGSRNYASNAARSIARKARGIEHAEVWNIDYRHVDTHVAIGPDVIIYCDPPYANTLAYAGAGSFDSAEFWGVAREWARAGASVFVSEYTAPDDWSQVWEKSKNVHLAGGADYTVATERLFTFGPERPAA